ncbi:MAG: hypothetical protein HZB38_16120, partial [Planctomycetes bacterium]|nr:hypothetical protein [Planctomycetota bacterium]
LLITDLVQDAANPAKFDIPIASSVPAGMTNFARPAGVTNPGDGTASLGYRGVQRGTAGQKNLIQIGGAQNTFGTARPAGSGVAESANVVANVGQSGSQLLASGSFTMPSACGTYVFRLVNVGANVLVQRNNPPAFSPVTQPTINASAGTITITVGLLGDLDGNGVVDLTDLTSFLSQFGMSGPGLTADLNGDQVVDLTDLTTFLSAYGQTC